MFVLAGAITPAFAFTPERDLTDLSLEELMEIEVTSVSRKQEPLFEAAAAVSVLTGEDLRRAGVTNLPEALRLVPGMQVAQVSSSQYAISARGFNNQFANKLLVLVDGRSVYTPLFAGVYWDTQGLLLEDIERIEVVRGPGATLWGANAVNGVVNVITKHARDTAGWLVTAGGGSEERAFFGIRGGGHHASFDWAAHTHGFDRDAHVDADGHRTADDWRQLRGGFRLDRRLDETGSLTFEGEVYSGRNHLTVVQATPVPPYSEELDADADLAGGWLLGRWTQTLSPRSSTALQASVDRTTRRDPFLDETRHTVDVDFQHDLVAGSRQRVIWGLGYRYTTDDIIGTFVATLDPGKRSDQVWSAFVQDELTLRPDRVRVTVGSKFEHNDYTGVEIQPNVRLLWTPDPRHSAWGSVARAVRTPSRVENDVLFVGLVVPAPGGLQQRYALVGNRNLESDDLLAWELGYRVHPTPRTFLDFAAFYNVYDDLGTLERAALDTIPGDPPYELHPQRLENRGSGETWGVEVAGHWTIDPRWTLTATYAWLEVQLHRDPGSQDANATAGEGSDPTHQFGMRSLLTLPAATRFDLALYCVSELPGQGTLGIPSYSRLDATVGWTPSARLDLAVTGQNLLEPRHPEFGTSITSGRATEVQRAVHGKVTWRF